MKQRNPVSVVVLGTLFGPFYQLYWRVSTKNDLLARGADIPTAWLATFPITNFYFDIKYANGADEVLEGGMRGGVIFFLMQWLLLGVVLTQFIKLFVLDAAGESTVWLTSVAYFLGALGIAFIQDVYNEYPGTPVGSEPAAPPSVDSSQGRVPSVDTLL